MVELNIIFVKDFRCVAEAASSVLAFLNEFIK
jgi:hypothetical protein